MNNIIDEILNDEEILKMKIEWLELDLDDWICFNFDEFSNIQEYKNKLKTKLEEFRNLSRKERKIIRTKNKREKISTKNERLEVISDLKDRIKDLHRLK